MKELSQGDRVVRTSKSPNTAQGNIGDQGRIMRVYHSVSEPRTLFGYNVIWDERPESEQFVIPGRLIDLATWESQRQERPA